VTESDLLWVNNKWVLGEREVNSDLEVGGIVPAWPKRTLP
jgi:hypothetical protein